MQDGWSTENETYQAIGEFSSTAQRGESLAQPIIQCFLKPATPF